MKTLRWILILSFMSMAFVAGYGYGRWYGKPASGAPPQTNGRRILYYHDPMHPAYKSDKPGIAPDCGMKLEPVYADDAPAKAEQISPMPPGAVKISAEKQQMIGVRYGEAQWTSGSQSIRAVGKVDFDERRIVSVNAKLDGWIEKVFVDFTGKLVEKGQPLVTIYSPDMLATQQEYLLALKAGRTMHHSTLPEAADYSSSLLAAARRRLELWDLSESQIEEIARTNTPLKTYTLFSPASGFVTERKAFPNLRISPDTNLYTITDLSRVWIMADVFEYEAAKVRLGQSATIRLSYFPGRPITARVTYIMPQVDPATRTIKVRLETDNPGFVLKPDMFVDVEFNIGLPRMLAVPVEAVLDTGLKKTVFVDRGSGYLEPRQVETGERIGDRIQILRGIEPGERVVTSGNFLIDSESQLKAAASGMIGHQHGAAPPSQPPPPAQPKPESPAAPEHHNHD